MHLLQNLQYLAVTTASPSQRGLGTEGLHLCSTATDLKEKWGHKYRPITHASRNRKSSRTVFFVCSSPGVVCSCYLWIIVIKKKKDVFWLTLLYNRAVNGHQGSARPGKQSERYLTVWSFTVIASIHFVAATVLLLRSTGFLCTVELNSPKEFLFLGFLLVLPQSLGEEKRNKQYKQAGTLERSFKSSTPNRLELTFSLLSSTSIELRKWAAVSWPHNKRWKALLSSNCPFPSPDFILNLRV